jgi:streptogramin lyase
MQKYRLAVTLLAIAALATGCSGGGSNGVSPLPNSPNVPGQSPARGAAAFTITVPAAATGAGVKRPTYISSNTMSVSIVETDGTAAPLPAVVANLTPTSPNCTTASGATACTIVVPANAGSDTFKVNAYDALYAGGNLLSTGTLTATILAGTANTTVPLTLGGVVASIVLTFADPYAPVGSTGTTLSVQAKDASGATIVGTYDNPIALSAGTGLTLGASSVADSTHGANIAATYAGNPVAPIAVTASADGKTGTATLTPGSGIVRYTLGNDANNDQSGFPSAMGPDGKFYYGTYGARICVNNICTGTNGGVGQLDPSTGAFVEIPLGSTVSSLTFTPDGALWIAGNSAGFLARIPAGGFNAAAVTQIPLPTNGKPRALTIGSDGNVWFTDTGTRTVGKISPAGPYVTASITEYTVPNGPAGTGHYLTQLGGIASGSDGNLYVADYYNGVVDQITTAGVTTNQFVTPGEIAFNPQGGDGFTRFVAAGTDGSIYVTSAGEGFSYPYNGRLDAMTTSGTFSNLPLTAFAYQPDSIAAGHGVVAFSDLANQSLGIYTIGAPSVVEIPTTDGFSFQSTGDAPNGVAISADGSPWYACYGATGITGQALCAGHLVTTSAWSVFPGRTINLYGLGVQSSQLYGIAESGNSGPFTFSSSNSAIATASANSDHNFTITGNSVGSATITVTDAHARSVTIAVNVTATSGSVSKSAKAQVY